MSTKEATAALARNKFEVIRVERSPRRHVYTVRVPSDPIVQSRWRQFMNDFIIGTEEIGQKKGRAKQYSWQLDFSKWFFPQGGVVKFAWRIMIVSDHPHGVERGENMLAQSAINALRTGVEVTSMPLIGRKEFRGKNIGGVYSQVDGAKALTQALGGGGQ